jgi:hypothetical protein
MGEFTIIGPSNLYQDRTCVSGQTCFFDGVLGQHLSTRDVFRMLDTCGTDVVHYDRNDSLSLNASNSSVEVQDGVDGDLPNILGYITNVQLTRSGAAVWWGDVQATFQGGQYRLCWCAGWTEGSAGAVAQSYTCSIA